jgi:hypothetical protein
MIEDAILDRPKTVAELEQALATLMEWHKIAAQRYREREDALKNKSFHGTPTSTELEGVETVRRDALDIEARIEHVLMRLMMLQAGLVPGEPAGSSASQI